MFWFIAIDYSPSRLTFKITMKSVEVCNQNIIINCDVPKVPLVSLTKFYVF